MIQRIELALYKFSYDRAYVYNYLMLVYLMLFAALYNAVCIMLFLLLIFANAFCFHALS